MNIITARIFSPAQVRDIARLVKRYRALKTRAGRKNAWNDAITRVYIADELIKQYMQIDAARA